MVAKLLLVVGIIALVFVACQSLVPGDEGLVVVFQATPPDDPTEAAQYYARRTQAAAEAQETKDARQANKAQADLDKQATLDERARRAAADERAAEAEALAYRVQLTQAAGEATARADNARRKETRTARETADERAWIVQGWTATADSAQATTTAAVALAAVQAQQTVDAAAVHAKETAIAAQGIIAAEAARQKQLETERQILVNNAAAVLPYIGWPLLFVTLVGVALYYRRHQVIRRDPNGAAPLVRVGDRVMDPDRSALPVLDPARPVQVPLEAHLQITGSAQKVQAVQAGLFTKTSPEKGLRLMQPRPGAPAVGSSPAGPASPAPWQAFIAEAGPIPLGAAPDGRLMLPDADEWPHRLFAGTTGGGKSRYGIRPYITGALGRSWQVIVIGDHYPVDFKVFEGQPNFHPLTLDDPAAVLPVLEALNDEVKRRWGVLYDRGASTWGRLDRADPRLVVVFDEYAALLDSLEGSTKMDFIRRVTNLSRLARKAGIHLAVGVQNPTADNLRPSIRRNMLPVAFHVVDRVASQVILEVDGAEKLVPPQYLARMQEVHAGVAFDPTDSQVLDYLAGRQITAWDPPSCLVQLPAPGDTEPVLLAPSAADPEIQRLAETIRPIWESGVRNKSELARRLHQSAGGVFWYKLSQAVQVLEAENPSSSTGGNGHLKPTAA